MPPRRSTRTALKDLRSISSPYHAGQSDTLYDDDDSDAFRGTQSVATTPVVEQRRTQLGKLNDPEKHAYTLLQSDKLNRNKGVPPTPVTSTQVTDKGFFELSTVDRNNFLLLVLLYFLQGIPLGLAHGSVPFLLKRHLSYSQIGIYTLATWPYSLKLLWSPIVDAIWTPKMGRRLSWIIPVQALSGIGMIYLGSTMEQTMLSAANDGNAGVWKITMFWFTLVFMCATQDIAVDGWAITLLAPNNLRYASSAQTVGITAGHFLSYTVFLAFNSKEFANKWFRSVPQDTGVISLGGYLQFAGFAYLAVTIGLALFKREDKTRIKEGVKEVYIAMADVLKLKNIQTIVVIHCIAKIGFMANESVASLKLLEKGFKQEDLALTALVDFPVEIVLGYYSAQWCDKIGAIPLWCHAFIGRLIAAGLAQLVVFMYPSGGLTNGYLWVIITEHVFSTFMGTVMFVAISAFHAKIADPVIGGTYMTLLATVSNLGGTFPRIFILKFVDMFTSATCIPPEAGAKLDLKQTLITEPFSCALEAERHRCLDGGGTCKIMTDGFYIVNVLCIVFGVISFFGYIKPAALQLGELPLKAWRVHKSGFTQ